MRRAIWKFGLLIGSAAPLSPLSPSPRGLPNMPTADHNAVEIVPLSGAFVTHQATTIVDLREGRKHEFVLESNGEIPTLELDEDDQFDKDDEDDEDDEDSAVRFGEEEHPNGVLLRFKFHSGLNETLAEPNDGEWQRVSMYDFDLERFATALLASIHYARTQRHFPGLTPPVGRVA